MTYIVKPKNNRFLSLSFRVGSFAFRSATVVALCYLSLKTLSFVDKWVPETLENKYMTSMVLSKDAQEIKKEVIKSHEFAKKIFQTTAYEMTVENINLKLRDNSLYRISKFLTSSSNFSASILLKQINFPVPEFEKNLKEAQLFDKIERENKGLDVIEKKEKITEHFNSLPLKGEFFSDKEQNILLNFNNQNNYVWAANFIFYHELIHVLLQSEFEEQLSVIKTDIELRLKDFDVINSDSASSLRESIADNLGIMLVAKQRNLSLKDTQSLLNSLLMMRLDKEDYFKKDYAMTITSHTTSSSIIALKSYIAQNPKFLKKSSVEQMIEVAMKCSTYGFYSNLYNVPSVDKEKLTTIVHELSPTTELSVKANLEEEKLKFFKAKSRFLN